MKIDDSFQDRNKNVSEVGPKLIKRFHNSLVCLFYEYLLISYLNVIFTGKHKHR